MTVMEVIEHVQSVFGAAYSLSYNIIIGPGKTIDSLPPKGDKIYALSAYEYVIQVYPYEYSVTVYIHC